MKRATRDHSKGHWARYSLGIVILLLMAVTSGQAIQPTAGISFAQVSFSDASQPYSRHGQVLLNPGALYGDGFLNIERYQDGRPAGWIVKNLPVINGSLPPGVNTRFDLGVSGLQYSFSAYVDYSPVPLADDSSLTGKVPLTYLLEQISPPADTNPNAFEDAVCHQNDKRFWTGQQSVLQVMTAINRRQLVYGDGTGWIIKGKDAGKILMITAAHNFTDAQAEDTSVTVMYQRATCGGDKNEAFWAGEVDEVLERNARLDFLIVSLKPAPRGKSYPPALRALYKEIKLNDLVTIPQHPAEKTPYKQAGYYYDIDNKRQCHIAPTPALNDRRGEIDAKCGAAYGTSGSPLLDGSEIKDDTPYAIGLIVGCRLAAGKTCKPLSAVGFKMSDICDYDAGTDGKKLLDCQKP